MSVVDLDKERRKQIGRRHERTFLSFYRAAKRCVSDSTLTMLGYGSAPCNSNYLDGCKVANCVPGLWWKETKSLKIEMDFAHGVMKIHLKEPDK